jgi:hypothetical protein
VPVVTVDDDQPRRALSKQGSERRVSRVFTLDITDVELLCVCYLASVATAQIRYPLDNAKTQKI